MKVLMILGLLCACAQASTDYPESQHKAMAACVKEKGLDLNKITEIVNRSILPEDHEFVDFSNCYLDRVGLVKDDGQLDLDQFKANFPQGIKVRYGDAVDADELTNFGFEQCNDIPKSNSAAITAIRMRSCVLTYIDVKLNV